MMRFAVSLGKVTWVRTAWITINYVTHSKTKCLSYCRYGVGSRFKLKHTRSIINAIHSGELNDTEYQKTPIFDLRVRRSIRCLLLLHLLTLH